MIENRDHAPGSEGWGMFRRALGCGELKYYPSHASGSQTMEEVARHGCLRWAMIQGFELAKATAGPDHYELTELLGWYHHTTSSPFAVSFMKTVQRSWQNLAVSISAPSVGRRLPVLRVCIPWDRATTLGWLRDLHLFKPTVTSFHRDRWSRDIRSKQSRRTCSVPQRA